MTLAHALAGHSPRRRHMQLPNTTGVSNGCGPASGVERVAECHWSPKRAEIRSFRARTILLRTRRGPMVPRGGKRARLRAWRRWGTHLASRVTHYRGSETAWAAVKYTGHQHHNRCPQSIHRTAISRNENAKLLNAHGCEKWRNAKPLNAHEWKQYELLRLHRCEKCGLLRSH